MTTSIIVPVHNPGEDFQKCINSLLAVSPTPAELIVAPDGAPNFDIADFCAEETDVHRFTVLPSTETAHGPAYVRNAGAEIATSDILLFIDADVTVSADIVSRIQAEFSNEPDLDGLIGSYDDQPGKSNFLSQYRNLLHHYVHQTSSEEASTFWGACGAIRRSTFVETGGFNESYAKPSIEDIELGYRVRHFGGKIKLCKSIQIKHLKYWDAISIIRTDLFQRAIPWTELLLKDKQFGNDLNLRYSHRLSIALVFILAMSILISLFMANALVASGICAATLLVLNKDLYSFFLQKRGITFLLGAIAWHWMYYAYSGIGFIIGLGYHFSGRGNG